MRKIVIILSLLMIMLGIYVPCFADTFVPSITPPDPIIIVDDDDDNPTQEPTEEEEQKGPTVIIEPDTPQEETHEVDIEVHSFQNIDEIENEESREQLKQAYVEISKIDNVADLVPIEIEEIAHEMGAETFDLVVRDLFDVTAYEDGQIAQTTSKEYSFSLHVEDLENFICLLVYHDNQWHVVKNVEVLKDENLLKVITKELSPFAIVVATHFRYKATIHGCIWHLYIVITMLVSFLLAQLWHRQDSDTKQIKKRNILIRDILCLISLVLSVIFYIFGTCKYDVYALIADIIIVTITFIYTHPIGKDNDNE